MEPAKLAALDLVRAHLKAEASVYDEGQSQSMMEQLQAHAPFQGADQQTAARYLLCDDPTRQTLNNASRRRIASVAWVSFTL